MTGIPTVLDDRFRAAAAASGELDVAYDVLDDTPVGSLLVGVSDRGLCRIGFDPEPEAELERLARQFGPRVLRAPATQHRLRVRAVESWTSTLPAAGTPSTLSSISARRRSSTGASSRS